MLGNDRHHLPIFLQDLFDNVYQVVPRHFLTRDFVYSLCLQIDENEPYSVKSEWWSWLTYMFVHMDYAHLISNLQSLVIMGYPAYLEYGSPMNFYAVFLAGGVFSAIPSVDRAFQALVGMQNDDTPKSLMDAKSWGRFLKSFIPHTTLYCGSSGAVSSLFGCNFIFAIRDVTSMIPFPTRGEYQQQSIPREWGIKQYSKLYRHSFNIYAAFSFLLGEISKMESQRKQASSESGGTVIDFVSNLFSHQTLISHSAHIKGFAFGAGLTILSISLPTLFQRKKPRTYDI
jgi:membrane associated rhomboid family serine protease